MFVRARARASGNQKCFLCIRDGLVITVNFIAAGVIMSLITDAKVTSALTFSGQCFYVYSTWMFYACSYIENYPGRVEALASKISERAPAFLREGFLCSFQQTRKMNSLLNRRKAQQLMVETRDIIKVDRERYKIFCMWFATLG